MTKIYWSDHSVEHRQSAKISLTHPGGGKGIELGSAGEADPPRSRITAMNPEGPAGGAETWIESKPKTISPGFGQAEAKDIDRQGGCIPRTPAAMAF